MISVRWGKLGSDAWHLLIRPKARWREPLLDDLTAEQLERVDLNELWNPKLFTENSLGAPKSKVWRELWKEPKSGEIYVTEKRVTGGVWGETLELWDFPFDCQDLSGEHYALAVAVRKKS